jgi:hypothetical protein
VNSLSGKRNQGLRPRNDARSGAKSVPRYVWYTQIGRHLLTKADAVEFLKSVKKQPGVYNRFDNLPQAYEHFLKKQLRINTKYVN